MDKRLIGDIIVLIVLLLLSAYFSSAETSFTMTNKIRMRSLADNGNRRAKRVLRILDDQHKMLSTILVGNNIVNLSASSLSTMIAVKLLGNYGAGIATFIITFLILIVGEISPKTMATIYSEKLALAFSGSIWFLMWVLTPIVVIVNLVSKGLLNILGINTNLTKPVMTEGELKTIVDVGHEDGVIESGERKIIYNLFDFSDAMAKEIMVPHIDMVVIEVTASYDDLMKLYRKEKVTRIPVYENTSDNIIGFINMKDILLIDDPSKFSIRKIMRQPYYTHEHKNISELLMEMRERHINIAIVLDEYGNAAGMITMEDLLEEIVGEIRDEYDDDEVDMIRKATDTEYIVDGGTPLDDINEAFGLELESEDYDTIGGYLIGLSDSFPKNGQIFVLDGGIRIRVSKIENNRIVLLRFYLPRAKEKPAAEKDAL